MSEAVHGSEGGLPVGVPLRREGGRWVAETPAAPLVIDSWRVVDTAVRRLDLHIARFTESCRRHGFAEPGSIADLVTDGLARLPARGDFFPRVELVGEGDSGETPLGVRLLVRPSPPSTPTVAVWTAGRSQAGDPRTKGADLAYYTRCREEALAHGAAEAVLLDADGHLTEGATTSLAWWRGDRLHVVATRDVLDGVTVRLLRDLAAADGVDVRQEAVRPVDLTGCEVWVVNALHGIRAVDEWVGADVDLAPPRRRDDWQRRLEALRTPVRR